MKMYEKLNIIEWIKILLHKVRHEHGKLSIKLLQVKIDTLVYIVFYERKQQAQIIIGCIFFDILRYCAKCTLCEAIQYSEPDTTL